ncbi:hypothetical protein HC723_15680 [Vibrio sp. S11_S32]|uniref:hypothetical protein n=1 Tax=Vibrio sp. S11_S32 TaxID=2720225 RepID=UPI001681AD02|nr:hypothetical protein [Vibrio sp. S11_S32]MBD1577838.1 hypothetical protein [Vibrio sp. S11_S32]
MSNTPKKQNENLKKLKSSAFIKSSVSGLNKQDLISLKSKINHQLDQFIQQLDQQEMEVIRKRRILEEALKDLDSKGLSVDDIKALID